MEPDETDLLWIVDPELATELSQQTAAIEVVGALVMLAVAAVGWVWMKLCEWRGSDEQTGD